MRAWIAVPVLLVSSLCSAEIFRWVDEQGRVHYSDRDPGDTVAAETVEVDTGDATLDPEREADRKRSRRLLKVWEEERQLETAKQEQLRQLELQQEAYCQRLAAEYQKAREAQYIYQQAEGDERRILSKAERRQYEQRLSDEIRQDC